MKSIEFTKDQFLALLKLAFMGEWVVNAHRLPSERIDKFEDLEYLLYSNARHFGLENLVIHDPKSGEFHSSRDLDFDEEILRYIREYDNETFWTELCDRLAERDAIRVHGEEKLRTMDPRDRFRIISDLEEEYQEKFSIEGLDNI